MRLKKPNFEPRKDAVIPTQGADLAGAQISGLLTEIQNTPDIAQIERALPRHVARPLRGFRLMDIAALTFSFVMAWAIALIINSLLLRRYDLDITAQDALFKISQSLLVGAGVIIWFTHKGHYRIRMPFWTEIKQIIEGMSFAMLIDIFFRFLVKQDFSRLWLVLGWVLATAGIIAFRALWRSYQRKRNTWNVSTLLIGRGESADEARLALASEPGLGFQIVAQVCDLQASFKNAGYSWKTLCEQYNAHYIIIALDGQDLMKASQPFAQLMREDMPFSVAPPMHTMPVLGMAPQYFFNHDVMLLTHNHGLNQRMPRLIKRTFDVVVAFCVLLIASPVLLIVALLVKLDGGPALFGHKRLGLNGQSFPCLKFRSMITNSDAVLRKYLAENVEARAEWEKDHKLRNDPRVTRLGAFIRRTSIDELPQFLNVLKGDMSIVGPRPIIVAETGKYDNDISHYYRVCPGITGLWQVSGRNDVSYAQRVQMDSWYVRNWSLWHDIAIICKTIPVVLKSRGAY